MGCCNSNTKEKAEFLLHEQKQTDSEMTTGCDSPNFKYLQNNEAESPLFFKPLETPKFGRFDFNEAFAEEEETLKINSRDHCIIKNLRKDFEIEANYTKSDN
ncbi:unnamed protein product [Blepharisma stoltei]|uniref:Uncharacterized protein n=1 Tax=Blepharisma stoltei TaxID=1481888 RepID=A0AAU9JLL3_9CILI|nr:unnamed protein product [Blepharisma stoltei]